MGPTEEAFGSQLDMIVDFMSNFLVCKDQLLAFTLEDYQLKISIRNFAKHSTESLFVTKSLEFFEFKLNRDTHGAETTTDAQVNTFDRLSTTTERKRHTAN